MMKETPTIIIHRQVYQHGRTFTSLQQHLLAQPRRWQAMLAALVQLQLMRKKHGRSESS